MPPCWAPRCVAGVGGLAALSLHYGHPMGDQRLRQALSRKLDEFGIKADASQIITTVGAANALDIVSRTLVQAGDAVLVDEPGWAAEFSRLQLMGVRILPVPRGPEGPDLQVLAQLAQAHRPKLYVTVSVLHNPTSVMLSPGHAHQVLRLAEQHDFHILEDDIYAFLAPAHATRLSVLDDLRRTISIGSFSKVLTPGWRVGYIAAPTHLVDRLVNTKLLTTLTTPPVLEQALAHCMSVAPALRARHRSAGCGPGPLPDAGTPGRVPVRHTAPGAVWLDRCGCGHRTADPPDAGRGLADRARGLVPCTTQAHHADAHQHGHIARRRVLEGPAGRAQEPGLRLRLKRRCSDPAAPTGPAPSHAPRSRPRWPRRAPGPDSGQ